MMMLGLAAVQQPIVVEMKPVALPMQAENRESFRAEIVPNGSRELSAKTPESVVRLPEGGDHRFFELQIGYGHRSRKVACVFDADGLRLSVDEDADGDLAEEMSVPFRGAMARQVLFLSSSWGGSGGLHAFEFRAIYGRVHPDIKEERLFGIRYACLGAMKGLARIEGETAWAYVWSGSEDARYPEWSTLAGEHKSGSQLPSNTIGIDANRDGVIGSGEIVKDGQPIWLFGKKWQTAVSRQGTRLTLTPVP